jgi:hypothetical protein
MVKQQKTENPMGAGKKQALRVTFDSHLKLEFHGSKVPLPEKNGGRTGKRTCEFVEQEENQKKAHAGRGQETKWEMSVNIYR